MGVQQCGEGGGGGVYGSVVREEGVGCTAVWWGRREKGVWCTAVWWGSREKGVGCTAVW